MKYHDVFITIGVVILFICVVGCTSDTPSTSKIALSPSAQPVTPQLIRFNISSTIEPADMALQPMDLPPGFTIQERRERTRSDLSQSALDRGWIKGYHIMFGRKNESTLQVEFLTQDIDVYPVENVNQALIEGNAEMIQRSEDAYRVDQLSNPNIGDSSQAYAVELVKKSKKINAIGVFYQFVKKDVYEQIVMLSTSGDSNSLKEIAKTASAKIK